MTAKEQGLPQPTSHKPGCPTSNVPISIASCCQTRALASDTGERGVVLADLEQRLNLLARSNKLNRETVLGRWADKHKGVLLAALRAQPAGGGEWASDLLKAMESADEPARVESLAAWLGAQTFHPEVLSIAAATIRALYSGRLLPNQAIGSEVEKALADNVWHALDKVSCPGVYMQVAVKAVHDTLATKAYPAESGLDSDDAQWCETHGMRHSSELRDPDCDFTENGNG